MKHQKEWHTCDRCGKEIKLTLVRRGAGTIREEKQKCYDYETKENAMNKMLEEFEVVLFTSKTELDLCPKCRKDFERFMRNETGSRK